MYNWKKLGKIFTPQDFKRDWLESYSWVPIVDELKDGYFRIYFTGRNKDNLSQPGAFTIHIDNPTEIIDFSKEPVVRLGELGSFDDSGIIPSYLFNHNGKKHLYYSGWMQGKRVPFYSALGLAISSDNGKTFSKYSTAPFFSRTDVDPYFTAAVSVLKHDDHFKMWYTTNTMWHVVNGVTLPKYHIKYATSVDGINWKRDGHVAIGFKNDNEYAISRPWVIFEDNIFKMWYAYRGENYRIGYAESNDGVDWTRKDEVSGIDVSKDGFDSKMIEYAAVINYKDQKYMFYNGNNYGESGIGLAVAQK